MNKKTLLRIYHELGINEIYNLEVNVKNNPIHTEPSSVHKIANILEFNDMVTESRKLADSARTLDELKEIVFNFEGCNLKKTATNTVFCDGVISSKIMLIGEAPGANEDLQGRPFCGDSGKLLDLMFKSINLSRDKNLYISNCIFWRPPGNRKPTDEEIEICKPFIEKHIALINPKLLILVGGTALNALIDKKANITNFRKIFFDYSNPYTPIPLKAFAIFHPAYLLRQPMQKKESWYDLLMIEEYLKNNS